MKIEFIEWHAPWMCKGLTWFYFRRTAPEGTYTIYRVLGFQWLVTY